MRHPRIKPEEDTFVHVYNRCVGTAGEFPFGPTEKEQIGTAVAVAAEKEPFVTQLDRRVRYWVDGLVIGSDLFVRNTLAKYRTVLNLKKRRFVRALRPDRQPEPALCCFKQLRVLTE